MQYKIAVWLLVFFAHYYAVAFWWLPGCPGSLQAVAMVFQVVFSTFLCCCQVVLGGYQGVRCHYKLLLRYFEWFLAHLYAFAMVSCWLPGCCLGVLSSFFSTFLMYAVARVFCWLPKCCYCVLSGSQHIVMQLLCSTGCQGVVT